MLFTKNRGWNKVYHLLGIIDCLKRSSNRNLGLAVADIPADQAVHDPRALHVVLDRRDGVELVEQPGVGGGDRFEPPREKQRRKRAEAAGEQVAEEADSADANAGEPRDAFARATSLMRTYQVGTSHSQVRRGSRTVRRTGISCPSRGASPLSRAWTSARSCVRRIVSRRL